MERFGQTSHRVLSVRSIFSFVLVVIITALLLVAVGSKVTHAAPFGTDASWSGDTIIYDDHGFTATSDYKDTTGTIPSGSKVYQAPLRGGNNDGTQKAFIIYFTPGVDPPTATSAKYVEFKYQTNKDLTDPINQKDIALTVKGEETQISSCSVGGIGWLICPVSVFIAGGMDWIFNVLASLISVHPTVLGDSNNSMYVAWNAMRNIANVAFVMVFLVIIYSQLTNFGVSNYGLKKLIPRLIVAAVLVNISFVITAAAIDISNILGYSIQNLFNAIGKNVFNMTGDSFAGVNNNPWTVITGIVLAGGGYFGATYFISSGTEIMLVPLLLGLVLTLLLVVMVLAARQAIIVILVIIAPLAFIANLLPNTEKWFDKWKDLLLTMLIFFPAFSLVFGGSQLAGQLIIMNAGDNIVTVIFGLAVQVAPLVITPLLLKLSGSLLGKIAQIANNPSKGVLDRNKKWANDRAEEQRRKTLSKQKLSPFNLGGKVMKASDTSDRKSKSRTELYKLRADNNYHASPAYEKIHTSMVGAEDEKSTIENTNARHIEGLRRTRGSEIYDSGISSVSSKERLETAQNRTTEYYNGLRVTNVSGPLNASMREFEASKADLETSENAKTVYLDQQRMLAGTVLNRTVAPLEASKLRVESTKNQYSNMVENMKLDPASTLYNVAQGAQSSKEILEASQAQVQALFDRQRTVAGTGLNLSTIQLEESKSAAESAKSLATAYVNSIKVDETTVLHRNVVQAEDAKLVLQTSESELTRTLNVLKADETTPLHLSNVRAEQAKLATQVSEGKLSRTIEEYKTGELTRTGDLDTLMESMVSDVSELAAETQGTQAAKNIQTQKIAQAFTATDATGAKTARAQELLDIAASVDEYGGVRAEANALSTLDKITAEARGSNVKLIEARALEAKMPTKDYAVKELLEKRLAGTNMSESDDLINAALEIAGQEAQIPLIRKIRQSGNFDQEAVSGMLYRQSAVMKTKGGFDLQANYDLANVSEQTMDASIAGSLGSVSAKDYPGLKFAAIKDYADRIDDIVTNAENETNPAYGPNAREGLQKTYFQLSIALQDPELVRELGDNLVPAIDMHKRLHRKFQNPDVTIEYDNIDPRYVRTGPMNPTPPPATP